MKTVKKIKCNIKDKLTGRDKVEVQPEENINADKTAVTYSEFQRKPQSKSVRYTKTLVKPYRAPRLATKNVRRKKI